VGRLHGKYGPVRALGLRQSTEAMEAAAAGELYGCVAFVLPRGGLENRDSLIAARKGHECFRELNEGGPAVVAGADGLLQAGERLAVLLESSVQGCGLHQGARVARFRGDRVLESLEGFLRPAGMPQCEPQIEQG
jgi:hypothetical protein